MPTQDATAAKRKPGRPIGSLARYVTIRQVSEALNVPEQTVYSWTRQLAGDEKPVLPTKKFGRFVRVKESDVERLSERLASRPASSFFSDKEGNGDG